MGASIQLEDNQVRPSLQGPETPMWAQPSTLKEWVKLMQRTTE